MLVAKITKSFILAPAGLSIFGFSKQSEKVYAPLRLCASPALLECGCKSLI